MARITGEIVIERPPEEVFDFVAAERNEPSYNHQMLAVEQLTEGPVGSGTRFQAQMGRGRPGEERRTLPMLVEFTTFERPRRLGSVASFAGVTTDGELTFVPRGDTTLLRWSWDVTLPGALRLLAPLVLWTGRREERRVWQGLKRLLEEGRPV